MWWKSGKDCLTQKYLQKIQGKALKKLFNVPIIIPYIGLRTETGVWQAEQRINYTSLMLYHNIINSSKDWLVKQINTGTKTTKSPKFLMTKWGQ